MEVYPIADLRLGRERRDELRELLESSFRDEKFKTSTFGMQPPALRMLAVENARLVGHISVAHQFIGSSHGRELILGLNDVCVLSSARRRGVASKMLSSVDRLAADQAIEFIVLFAKDTRLYDRQGYVRVETPFRWLWIQENRSTGIEEQPIDGAMVKQIGTRAWPGGCIDLMGHCFST